MIIDLSFKELEIGSQVKTRSGFIWTKLPDDKWCDETSKLIWLPEIHGEYDHYEAEKLQNDKQRLPTKEEFEESEKHGIREILDMRNKWYWSASVDPNGAGYAYYFYGSYGDFFGYDRSNGGGSVRLVSR